jgi:hypothetical protein
MKHIKKSPAYVEIWITLNLCCIVCFFRDYFRENAKFNDTACMFIAFLYSDFLRAYQSVTLRI